MRIGVEPARGIGNADEVEEPLRLGPDGAARQPAMQRQRLADLLAEPDAPD